MLDASTTLSDNVKRSFSDIKKNKDNIISKLEWLSRSCEILSDKIGLSLQKHQNIKKLIPRSSYKFCSHGSECEFNYNHKNHTGCLAQHFVYNLVYADIQALVGFVQNNDIDNIFINICEVNKCLSTISYVINHMNDELHSLVLYNKDYTKYHKERTPNGKKKYKERNIQKKNRSKFK